MPESISKGLTPQHILSALADLDAETSHPFGPPTGYQLLHQGKRYAPKAVVGLAFKNMTGRMLAPGDFSGGEAPGQANHVLRNLGFEIVKKGDGINEAAFVTSRGYSLPIDTDKMAEEVWFNLWQRRLWPYLEVQEGDALFWYDATEKAIVWQSRVGQIERLKFANKNEVRKRFIDRNLLFQGVLTGASVLPGLRGCRGRKGKTFSSWRDLAMKTSWGQGCEP
jgi:hypothetical protein